MRVIGYYKATPSLKADSLSAFTAPLPTPTRHDLLVKISAIAVNPVDAKIRKNIDSGNEQPKVIGWDAVGEVVAIGEDVTGFELGDRVYYAGDLTRPGCNAEYQLVDARITAKAPTTLDDAQAAALPLTTITAWELLFDRLALHSQSQGNILVIGAAGGVGSMAIQLLKQRTNMTVIATASRSESQDWCRQLGADHVVDHTQGLAEQCAEFGAIPYVVSLTHTDQHLNDIVSLIAPQGKLALIDDPLEFDIRALKQKSISLHWEFMYTRSMFSTDDMHKQGELLCQVADMVDAGQIKTTLGQHLGAISVDNLLQAHAQIETGRTVGKIVLTGFSD
jgi:NADPH2:quinone reductase